MYTDDYYTSLELARYLLSTGTNFVGTIGRTSRGVPRIDTSRLGQGNNADGIVVRRYVDESDAYSLSTATAGNDIDVPKARSREN